MQLANYAVAAAVALNAVAFIIGTRNMADKNTSAALRVSASISALTAACDQLIGKLADLTAAMRETANNAEPMSDVSIQLNAAADKADQEVAAIAAALAASTGQTTDAPAAAPEPEPVTVTLGTDPLPSGVVGQDYSAQLTASGGSGPYTFATLDALPAGLTLDSSGAIVGTPSEAGGFSLNVTATDADHVSGSGSVSISISAS